MPFETSVRQLALRLRSLTNSIAHQLSPAKIGIRRRLTVERLEDRTLLSAGTLDLSFGLAGQVTTSFSVDLSQDEGTGGVTLGLPDGGILVSGVSTSSGTREGALVRYLADGDLDTSFGNHGQVLLTGQDFDVRGAIVQSGGKIVLAGTLQGDFAAVRLNGDGSLDTTFGNSGWQIVDFGSTDSVGHLVQQSDGKIVIAGYAMIGSNYDIAVVRLNSDGTLDSDFGNHGRQSIDFGSPEYGSQVAIDASGGIIVAGYGYGNSSFDFVVTRLNADGSLDTHFGDAGRRLIDFGNGGGDSAAALAIDSAQRIVIAGTTDHRSGTDFAIARLLADGTLDQSFGENGQLIVDLDLYDDGRGVAIDKHDRIVLVGETDNGVTSEFAVIRLETDGLFDTTFGTAGLQTISFEARSAAYGVAFDSADRLVIAGSTTAGANVDFAIARLLGDPVGPTAQDDAFETTEDDGFEGNVLEDNGQGADASEGAGPLTVVAQTNIAGSHGGLFSVNSSGLLTFTPNGEFEDLAEGEIRTTTFFYTVEDDQGGTDSAQVTVTVAGVNDSPVAKNDELTGVLEDATATLVGNVLIDNGEGADHDPDTNDVLTVSAQTNIAGSQGGRFTITVNGDVTFDPNGEFLDLSEGESRTTSFVYTLLDNHGGTDFATASVTVTGVNLAPSAADDLLTGVTSQAGPTAVGNVLIDNGNGPDHDPDASDTLSVEPVTDVAGSFGGLFTITESGDVTFDPHGEFDDLAPGETRTTSLTYTLRDNHGAVSTAIASVTVTGADLAPTAQDDELTTTESTSATGNLLANDVSLNPLATLTVLAINDAITSVGTTISLDSGALLTVNSNGEFTYDPNDAFLTVNFGESLTDSVWYTISDGLGETATALVTIFITGIDDGLIYDGSTLTVVGTDLDDLLIIDLFHNELTLNGATQRIATGITQITVDGLGGYDLLILQGTDDAETVQLWAGGGSFVSSGTTTLSGLITSVEAIQYHARGPESQVTFYDSEGNDTFTGRTEWSRMFGPGYQNWAFNAGMVLAVARSGGMDRANLFDTDGDDIFTATATQGGFNTTGVSVRWFEKVVAFAGSGADRAILHGTAGDDIFSGRSTLSILRGMEYFNQVNGFARVIAHARTGTDVANLWGTSGSETFSGRPTDSVLSGDGYRLEAHGFDRVIGYAAPGGTDRAFLFDSTGSDRMTGVRNLAQIVGPSFITRAIGFGRVTIDGTAGGTNRHFVTDPLFYSLSLIGPWS